MKFFDFIRKIFGREISLFCAKNTNRRIWPNWISTQINQAQLNFTWIVSEECISNFFILGNLWTPGVSMGTQIKDLFRWAGLSLVVAKQHIQSACKNSLCCNHERLQRYHSPFHSSNCMRMFQLRKFQEARSFPGRFGSFFLMRISTNFDFDYLNEKLTRFQ